MTLCDYGCGQEANYILKNGKNCCCKSPNSCPINKEKNRQKRLEYHQRNPNKKLKQYKIFCRFCSKEITKGSQINQHEASCSLNPLNFPVTSWNIIPCERCGHAHNGEFGNGRFCSRACANSNILSDETREKISKFILNSGFPKKYILSYFNSFEKLIYKTFTKLETNKKLKQNAINRHAKNDGNIGWRIRPKSFESYPEKFFRKYFTYLNIFDYEREYRVGKYFIDFAFLDKKIAFEVDGKQHEEIERMKSDKRKDVYLKENGWKVFRIKYYDKRNVNHINMKEIFENDFLSSLR